MRHLLLLLAASLCFTILTIHPLQAQSLPSEGVIFDDFKYDDARFVHEINTAIANNPDTPPDGSLYGYNPWRTSTSSTAEDSSRLWYQTQWQEIGDITLHGELELEAQNDKGFLKMPLEGGNTYDGHEGNPSSPQQIATGFTARRGTWAARVIFDDLPQGDSADIIQGFWTLSPAHVLVNGNNEWNEIDFEWNSAFADDGDFTQYHEYIRTGYTVGYPLPGDSDSAIERPLFGPAWGGGGAGTPIEAGWSCKYNSGSTFQLFPYESSSSNSGPATNSRCTDVLLGNDSVVTANNDSVSVIVIIQVTDDHVFMEMTSHGWGGTIVANTERLGPTTNLPMMGMFSQYVASESTLSSDVDFLIDWFYYSPSTTIDINDVFDHVELLRGLSGGGAERFNNTGIDLERPEKPLNGLTTTYGYEDFTTPLSMDFIYPSTMSPNQSTRLLALPPEREGLFRYTWRYKKHYTGGGSSNWIHMSDDNFDMPFTFPSGVTKVTFDVTLEEVTGDVNPTPINSDPVFTLSNQQFTIFDSTGGAKRTDVDQAIPLRFELDQNYPNPFNPSTEISYALQEDTHVRLEVFNVLGQKVATLVDGFEQSGYKTASWDGKDSAGDVVATGVYLYRLEAGDFTETKHMVLSK